MALCDTDPKAAAILEAIGELTKALQALPHPARMITESSADFPALNRPCGKNQVSITQEACIRRLCCWLPPSYREAILGDLLEDCCEYTNNGATEKQIQRYVSWEILLAAVRSWPAAFVAVVKRAFISTK